MDVVFLYQDIRDLIAQGLTDQQVVERLELSAQFVPAIAHIRNRADDNL